MKAMKVVTASAFAMLALAGIASAGSQDGPNGPWADAVERFVAGPRVDGSPVAATRSNPDAALGPAEAPTGNDNPIPEGTFVSLGFGGELTLAFQNPICNGPGDDFAINVREITKEPYPPETADVYVSADGIAFTKVGRISRDAAVAVPKSIPIVWFVALVDVTDHMRYTFVSDADGFDIDGISAADSASCTGAAPPLPPAGSGDPLANTPPLSPTVKCTTSYWRDPRVLRVWPISRSKGFDTVFGVKAFPRKTLLAVIEQRGGGRAAVAREGVYALLTSVTRGSGYAYKPATVKRLVKTALAGKKAKLWSQTITRLTKARSRGLCPRPAAS